MHETGHIDAYIPNAPERLPVVFITAQYDLRYIGAFQCDSWHRDAALPSYGCFDAAPIAVVTVNT